MRPVELTMCPAMTAELSSSQLPLATGGTMDLNTSYTT